MTGQQKTALSVFAATMKGLSMPDTAKASHTLNLHEFMAMVRAKALGNEPYLFGTPKIVPIPKATRIAPSTGPSHNWPWMIPSWTAS